MWHENKDNVMRLANWLHENGGFADVNAVLYYFSKPWKYEDEWNEMLIDETPDDDETLTKMAGNQHRPLAGLA